MIDTTADDTMFEGNTWGWDGIDSRDVIAQNQNEPSFKNSWIPQRLSYIDIFLHCLHIRWLRKVLLPSTSRVTKEAEIDPLILGDLLRYLGLWILMYTCYGRKREDFWSATPFDQYENLKP